MVNNRYINGRFDFKLRDIFDINFITTFDKKN